MKTQEKIPLPNYIIEKLGNVWYIYNTETCISLPFETRIEAELKLKTICK